MTDTLAAAAAFELEARHSRFLAHAAPVATALLIVEHRLLSPTDMSRFGWVFLRINAAISLVLFLSTLAAVLLSKNMG